MSSVNLPLSPQPPEGPPPPPYERHVDWNSRRCVYRQEDGIFFGWTSTADKIHVISMIALISLIVGYACQVVLTASRVSLLAFPALKFLALFTGYMVLSAYLNKIYGQETHQDRERLIEQRIMNDPDLKISQILAMFPKSQEPFSKDDFDVILFEKEVNQLSYAEFAEKHGIPGIKMLLDHRKAALKVKFEQYIRYQVRVGLEQFVSSRSEEINAFDMSRADVWNLISQYERKAYSGQEFRDRNGMDY